MQGCVTHASSHVTHPYLYCFIVTHPCLQALSSFAHNTSGYKAKAQQYNHIVQGLGQLAG